MRGGWGLDVDQPFPRYEGSCAHAAWALDKSLSRVGQRSLSTQSQGLPGVDHPGPQARQVSRTRVQDAALLQAPLGLDRFLLGQVLPPSVLQQHLPHHLGPALLTRAPALCPPLLLDLRLQVLAVEDLHALGLVQQVHPCILAWSSWAWAASPSSSCSSPSAPSPSASSPSCAAPSRPAPLIDSSLPQWRAGPLVRHLRGPLGDLGGFLLHPQLPPHPLLPVPLLLPQLPPASFLHRGGKQLPGVALAACLPCLLMQALSQDVHRKWRVGRWGQAVRRARSGAEGLRLLFHCHWLPALRLLHRDPLLGFLMCFFPFCYGGPAVSKTWVLLSELCVWDSGLGREQIFLSRLWS